MSMTSEEVLAFWFEETPKENWFKKDLEFDALVRDRFASVVDRLAREIGETGTTSWEGSPGGDLASVIVLDQFPRNINRNSASAFDQDEKAVALVKRAMSRNSHIDLPDNRRAFLFMPLMHSEDLEVQELSVACFTDCMEDQSNLRFANDHRDIIKRFGRFPHRNAVLGRNSTAQEIAFLEEGGFSG